MPSPRFLLSAAGLIIAGVVVFLFRLWQPEEQVRKHSAHLIQAIADKDWPKFAGFIGEDYHDQWNFDRAEVLQNTREVFRHFRDVRISAIGPTVRIENGVGNWRASIVVEATGDAELTEMVKTRVNTLQTPFELEWHRTSSKPWDWKLVAVRNPELNIPTGY
jgi:hypothetical protein